MKRGTIIILVCITTLTFLLRLNILSSYPLENDETNRDYLIAHHIVRYHEFPMTGPINGIYPALRNSPIYYYILASFLLIKDDILTLQYVNVVLQTAVIALLFFIGSKLFSPLTGLIAVVLASLSFEHLGNAAAVWQPHLMVPFFYTAVALMVFAWQKKTLTWWIRAGVTLTMAAAIHLSVFSFFPLFFFLFWQWIKKHNRPKKYIFALSGILFLTTIFLYLPTFLVLRQNNVPLLPILQKIIPAPQNFISQLWNGTDVLFDRMFFYRQNNIFSMNWIVLISIVVFSLWHLFFGKKSYYKTRFAFLIIALFQPVIFTSLFQTPIKSFWLTASFGLIVVAIAYVISLFQKQKGILIGLTVILIWVISRNFFYTPTLSPLWSKQHDTNAEVFSQTTQTLTKEITTIQQNEGYSEPTFFDIVYYVGDVQEPKNNAIWWIGLEKAFGRKFTKVINTDRGYQTTNHNDYLFLVCLSHFSCTETFRAQHPSYTIPFPVSLGKISIYIARQEERQER